MSVTNDKYNFQYTHIILILDSSGSMCRLAKDTIGSLKSFLDEQKKLPGECTMTFITFSSTSTVILDKAALESIDPSVFDKYSPSGCTALNDAIGKALCDNDMWLKELNSKKSPLPGYVVVAILTDGEENDSKQFTNLDIKAAIKTLTTKEGTDVAPEKDTPANDVLDEDATEVPPPAPEVFRSKLEYTLMLNKVPTKSQGAELVKKLDNLGVEFSFVYLGANIDSFAEGTKLGIAAQATANWGADDIGIRNANQQISYAVGAMRMKGQKAAMMCKQISNQTYVNNLNQAKVISEDLKGCNADEDDFAEAFDNMRMKAKHTEAKRLESKARK